MLIDIGADSAEDAKKLELDRGKPSFLSVHLLQWLIQKNYG